MVSFKSGVYLFAATSCGIAIGVTGLYIYLSKKRKINNTEDDTNIKLKLVTLEQTVDSLKYEINILKNKYLNLNLEEKSNLINENLDDNDEEYFDFPDSGEVEQTIQIPNGDVINDTVNEWEQWVQEIDALLENSSMNKQEIYDRIKDGEKRFGSTHEILWRLAKATNFLCYVADKDGDTVKKKQLVEQLYDYAYRAVNSKDGDNNANCHKWFAIACGKMADYYGTKERILSAQTFVVHALRAVELDPTDSTLYYLKGRFLCELSNLSWIERKIAKTIYADVPDANYNMALEALMEAHNLRSDWKELIYYISKVNYELKDYKECSKFIDIGLNLDVISEEDHVAHDNLLKLKTMCNKYL